MGIREGLHARPQIVCSVFGPEGEHALEEALYTRRTFALNVWKVAASGLGAKHIAVNNDHPFSGSDEHAKRLAACQQELAELRSKAPSTANDPLSQVHSALTELPGLEATPTWAELFELLHNHPVFPATTSDASRATLGNVHPYGHEQAGASGRAALTVHLCATDTAGVSAVVAFAALQRHKLCCEWLGVPASAEAAAALGVAAEPRWLDLTQTAHDGELDAAAITDLQRACEATGAPAALPGALAVFSELHATLSAPDAFARCVAALAVLATGGSLVLRVPHATSPLATSAAALLGRHFGRVSLFRPFAADACSRMLYLVAQHYERPSQMELHSLVALVDTVRAEAPAAPGAAFVTAEGFAASLQSSLAEAAAWEAERAEAEVQLTRTLLSGSTDLALASIGKRWLTQHGLDDKSPALVAEWKQRTAGWLQLPSSLKRPRAAFSATGHPLPQKQQALPTIAPHAPNHSQHPDAQNDSNGVNVPGNRNAGGRGIDAAAPSVSAAQGPEFAGPLQTWHESKGWEHVAHVHTVKWPPHVERPSALMVSGYKGKPRDIRAFWPLHAAPGDGAANDAFQRFLEYLARKSSTFGGRARLAVVKGATPDAPDLGLVAGTGRPGESVGIMFCLSDSSD